MFDQSNGFIIINGSFGLLICSLLGFKLQLWCTDGL